MVVQIKNLSGNTIPEYKVQETKRSRLILLHYGIFKIGWDWMILLCTFYIAITVPYNAAFVMTSDDGFTQRASLISDVIVEMLLVIGQLSLEKLFLTFHSFAQYCNGNICLSVCLSVTSYCVETAKCSVEILSRLGGSIVLALLAI